MAARTAAAASDPTDAPASTVSLARSAREVRRVICWRHSAKASASVTGISPYRHQKRPIRAGPGGGGALRAQTEDLWNQLKLRRLCSLSGQTVRDVSGS